MSAKSPLDLPLYRQGLQTLFNHLGGPSAGETRLREILHDFYDRMAADLMIGYFFAGKDVHSVADKQGDFLLRAMGARTSYSGKAPADAHGDIPPIRRGHFDRRLMILEATLKAHGLSDGDMRTWIGFENAFRSAILGENPSSG